jgi:ABC-2 type transport system ATP-binding protein
MAQPVHNATKTWDTVVSLENVNKTFRQRQVAGNWLQSIKGMFRPQFRDVHALSQVNLTIRQGEIVAYAGPNGAGKSTTIKMLSGLLSPDAGRVTCLGMNPVRDRVRYVSQIGVVFGQRTELWWDQPIQASFEWKRVVWDIPKDRYIRTFGLVRELLGLDDFLHTLARNLSLGQRMRADLALMLLHEPEILFLDEPTLGLDVLAKRNILNFIKTLNKEKQVTIMVTSHDMGDLEELAGRIVLIDKGRLAFDGDFNTLRKTFGGPRHLIIETSSATPPVLEGATHIESKENRHEYRFDAQHARISELLDQAAAQTDLIDVETLKAPIDEVIAQIYEQWSYKNAF